MNLQLFTSFLLLVTYPSVNNLLESDVSFIMTTSECSCTSANLIYECIVNTSTAGGVTLWDGSAFENVCMILLSHHQIPSNHSCYSGSIFGNINIVADTNGRYISLLYIKLNFDIIGKSIGCFYYDENTNKTQIGSSLISVDINHRYLTNNLLDFTWNSSIFSNINCSTICYNILAPNCGSCPTNTNHPTVTCTDVPADGSVCTFTVQIFVCEKYIGSANDSFPLKTAGLGLVLLPILTAGILLPFVVLATVLLWFLYKRYRTSNGFSQSGAAVMMHCQTQNSLHEMDANVYGDNMTTVKVFDNKLASGIYGSADVKVHRSQYEDYVPTTGEGKLDLESLRVYLRGRVTFQWYKFGAALGVPSNVLERFVKDSEKYSEEKALVKVLEYWLKNHPTKPSWHEVANALRQIIWTP